MPPVDRDTVRKSTQTIRVVLRDFCVKFLDHCYNPVMRAVRLVDPSIGECVYISYARVDSYKLYTRLLISPRRDAIRHKKGEENDETFYFWAMRFFMEFNRLYNFDVGLISETLSMNTFHLIQVGLV